MFPSASELPYGKYQRSINLNQIRLDSVLICNLPINPDQLYITLQADSNINAQVHISRGDVLPVLTICLITSASAQVREPQTIRHQLYCQLVNLRSSSSKINGIGLLQSVILEEKLLKRAFGRVNFILYTVAYYNQAYIDSLPLSSSMSVIHCTQA